MQVAIDPFSSRFDRDRLAGLNSDRLSQLDFILVDAQADRGASDYDVACVSGCGDEICISHFYGGLVPIVPELMLTAKQSITIHGA